MTNKEIKYVKRELELVVEMWVMALNSPITNEKQVSNGVRNGVYL